MKELSCGKIALFTRKILTVAMIIFLMSFIFGCIDSSIIDKLATGQALNEQETKRYGEIKDQFDKLVNDKKKEIELTHYKEATEAEISAGKRIYNRYKKDTKSEFDIRPEVCKKIGFMAGTKIQLPSKKNATVVGVFEDHIWFHVEGVTGATFSRNSNLAEFTKEGYKVIEEAPNVSPDTYVKTIEKSQQAASAETSKAETTDMQSKVQDDSETDEGIYFKPIKRIPYLKKEK